MKLRDLLSIVSSKDGDELFEKVTELLGKISIAVRDSNGEVKDLHTLCWEVAEVLNKTHNTGGK